MGHGGQELQWGPDPCALGRFPEANAPHLYRQVQGGSNRDPAQRRLREPICSTQGPHHIRAPKLISIRNITAF